MHLFGYTGPLARRRSTKDPALRIRLGRYLVDKYTFAFSLGLILALYVNRWMRCFTFGRRSKAAGPFFLRFAVEPNDTL